MSIHADLIHKLEAWRKFDFHADRQLADEILIADGWRVVPDSSFEGGFRWERGTNPVMCSSERTRPHVIHDLDTAIGVVPFGCSWRMTSIGERVVAQVWKSGEIFRDEYEGHSSRHTIAILIAALKYKAAEEGEVTE